MKKKLEADLMSIAHRILQIKDKSDINQLCIETRKLYEKLTVLQFVEEHFEGPKPTIGQAEIVEKMKRFFEENQLSEVRPIKAPIEKGIKKAEKIIEQDVVNTKEEEIEPAELINIDFEPAFELVKEEKEQETGKNSDVAPVFIEELLGKEYSDVHFVKVDQEKEAISDAIDSKKVSLNEKLSKGISVDLNDRIAFVKHLFNESIEDYNRVLNQLITFASFDEAKNFLEEMVKPDYNNWEGKEDYAQRFVEIIEKKFA